MGRTGNNIFQYLTTALFTLFTGHVFVPRGSPLLVKPITFSDSDYTHLIVSKDEAELREHMKKYENRNIVCNGFFQKTALLVAYRDRLLEHIRHTRYQIHCGHDQITHHIVLQDMIDAAMIPATPADIVISLRLDDYRHPSSRTTNIVPPEFYLNIIANTPYDRLYIICDTPRQRWEHAYLRRFASANPIFLHGTLEEDFGRMIAAPRLLHSNSTLCWIASWLGANKALRVIPNTGFYNDSQAITTICPETDQIIQVAPLSHEYIENLAKE